MFRLPWSLSSGRRAIFQASERNFGSGLLRFLLTAAFGVRELLLGEPYFHFKCFLVFGAEFVANTVLNRPKSALLQPFLQSRFVISAIEAAEFAAERAIEQGVPEELARSRQSGVEINRAEDGFVGVSEQTFFGAAAGFLFSRTEPQIIAQAETFGR